MIGNEARGPEFTRQRKSLAGICWPGSEFLVNTGPGTLFLPRRELFDLHARIVTELPTLPEADRDTTLANLHRVLAHPGLAPL
jgi:hypothetical protein